MTGFTYLLTYGGYDYATIETAAHEWMVLRAVEFGSTYSTFGVAPSYDKAVEMVTAIQEADKFFGLA